MFFLGSQILLLKVVYLLHGKAAFNVKVNRSLKGFLCLPGGQSISQ